MTSLPLPPSPFGHSAFRLALPFAILLLCGCPKPASEPKPEPAARPLEGVNLRLAVADDPALMEAIVRIRGEWTEQTGSELEVVSTTEKALLKADALPADAVLCASHVMGVLAERKLVAPVPTAIVRGDQWGTILELPKVREAAWGQKTMAVPFGSPVLCCYYRADLLENLGRRPPRTWSEYEDLAKLLAKNPPKTGDGEKKPWSGTIEPLAPGWAGLVFLARAAPYAKHRDNYSTLFSIDTMTPQVASSPMIQALEDLAAAAKSSPADPFAFDPAAVRAAFWRGECGMALTWPTAGGEGRGTGAEGREERGERRGKGFPERVDPAIRVGFVELPGTRRVFNLTGHFWQNRTEDDDTRVPLLGIAGRMGVVNRESKRVEAAFQLLLWLSDDRMSPQISAASPATTLFRQSNLKSPAPWVEKPVSALAAAQYAGATEAAMLHEQWLGALPLPGREEYLAALDEAVRAVVRGEKLTPEALLDADAQWDKITKSLGREKQKAAYRHSLGLE